MVMYLASLLHSNWFKPILYSEELVYIVWCFKVKAIYKARIIPYTYFKTGNGLFICFSYFSYINYWVVKGRAPEYHQALGVMY